MNLYISCLAILLFLVACSHNDGSVDQDDPIVFAQRNNVDLANAQLQAQSTLDYFEKAFAGNYTLNEHAYPTGDLDFYVKRDFVDGEVHEHMWIEVRYIKGDVFHGVLNSGTSYVNNVNEGDEVSALRSQVEDWIIVHSNGTHEGGYSVSVLTGGNDGQGNN